ncbi:MAG: hypothetical protein ACTSSQ_03390 [Alphaproteobacteria bacterium]
MARVRSPAYPSISLPSAIERIRKIYAVEGMNEIDRESFVKLLCYSGLTGPSSTLLSSLRKYQLTQKSGAGEIKISDLGMDIMFGEPADKELAMIQAANSPSLFAEINEKWPERQPSDENLRSYLARKGFSVKVLDQVINAYRDTMSLVTGESDAHESGNNDELDEQSDKKKTTRALVPMGMPPSLIEKTLNEKERVSDLEGPFEVSMIGSLASGLTVAGRFALKDRESVENFIKILEANKILLPASSKLETDKPDIGVTLVDVL